MTGFLAHFRRETSYSAGPIATANRIDRHIHYSGINRCIPIHRHNRYGHPDQNRPSRPKITGRRSACTGWREYAGQENLADYAGYADPATCQRTAHVKFAG